MMILGHFEKMSIRQHLDSDKRRRAARGGGQGAPAGGAEALRLILQRPTRSAQDLF